MSATVLAVFGLTALLALVSLLVPMSRRLALPYTVLLAFVGIVLGAVAAAGPNAPFGGDFLRALQEFRLPSDAFLYIFLPPLLFSAGLTIDVRRLMDDLWPVLLLAVVAVLACTAAVAGGLTWWSGAPLVATLILGAMVATTDTAAVVSIFREVGAPRRLSIIVEGESLLNDAAAIALFTVFIAMLAANSEFSAGHGLLLLVQALAGGALFGFVFARATVTLASWLRGSELTEITLTVALAYLSFIAGYAYLGVSGVVACVVAAMVVASAGRTRLSPAAWDALGAIWRQIDFWATSLIFVLGAMRAPEALKQFDMAVVGNVAVVFAAALVSRAVILWGLLPFISLLGAGQPIAGKYKTVLWWGGLRGAVTLALALSAAEHPDVPEEMGDFIFTTAVGYLLATLVVNGLTLRPLMKALKLDKLDDNDRAIRDRVIALARARIAARADTVRRALGLAPADGAPDTPYAFLLPTEARVANGLKTWTLREAEEALAYRRGGIVGRGLAELLRAQTDRLLDGLQTGGVKGYEAAAAQMVAIRPSMRLNLWIHRVLGWSTPLANALGMRLERLIVTRMIVDDLRSEAATEAAELLGDDAAGPFRAVLDARAQGLSAAIDALDLQYPDFARALRERYVQRASLGAAEAEYKRLLDDRVITAEIHEDLDADRRRHVDAAQVRPALDLGLRFVEMLRAVPLFRDLPEKAVTELAELLVPVLFLPGEKIVAKGERGREMYFIASGQVSVHAPNGLVRLKAGDFFGEMALLADQPRNADVLSDGYCNLLKLPRSRLTRLARAYPQINARIAEIAAARKAQNEAARR